MPCTKCAGSPSTYGGPSSAACRYSCGLAPGQDEAHDRVAAHSGECAVTDGWDLRSAGVASSTVTGIRSCVRPHPSPKG